MTKIRTRFAPSPTGRMHVGNLRTALYAYLITKHEGGDFILRIEDTDQERYVEGAVDIIYRTLAKTGLLHDEGPDKDKGFGPYVQSERQAQGIYLKSLLFCSDVISAVMPVRLARWEMLCMSLPHLSVRNVLEKRKNMDTRKNGYTDYRK